MEGTVGTREGLLRYGTGWRDTVGTREGLLRYETGSGHSWYTGEDSEVRNGIRGMVGTQENLLRYGTERRLSISFHNRLKHSSV